MLGLTRARHAAENSGADAKPVEEDENAEDDVDATEGAVERALTETAVKPSQVALGAKHRSTKPCKVSCKAHAQIRKCVQQSSSL